MRRSHVLIAIVVLCILAFMGWRHFRPVQITNPNPRGSNVIAFGDSLTSGVGAAPGQDYPAQLAKLAGVPVLNKGVPGDTTADALRRLERDVLASDPKIVIVLLGGNDLLQRLPQKETLANLEEIVTKVQDDGALVVLVGLGGSMFTGSYTSAYRDLARRRGAVLVPGILNGILDRPAMKADQIHPNGEGYRMMAERIHAKIKEYLQ
jgi:acyl-CoA thioesterase I